MVKSISLTLILLNTNIFSSTAWINSRVERTQVEVVRSQGDNTLKSVETSEPNRPASSVILSQFDWMRKPVGVFFQGCSNKYCIRAIPMTMYRSRSLTPPASIGPYLSDFAKFRVIPILGSTAKMIGQTIDLRSSSDSISAARGYSRDFHIVVERAIHVSDGLK